MRRPCGPLSRSRETSHYPRASGENKAQSSQELLAQRGAKGNFLGVESGIPVFLRPARLRPPQATLATPEASPHTHTNCPAQ